MNWQVKHRISVSDEGILRLPIVCNTKFTKRYSTCAKKNNHERSCIHFAGDECTASVIKGHKNINQVCATAFDEGYPGLIFAASRQKYIHESKISFHMIFEIIEIPYIPNVVVCKSSTCLLSLCIILDDGAFVHYTTHKHHQNHKTIAQRTTL